MMKVIYTNIPGHGHVNPSLPVVAELIQRGAQVIYYNTEEFRPQIERTGAEFRPYANLAITSADISRLLADGNIARVSVTIMEECLHVLPFMLDELRREQPDVVVFDSLALWGAAAARLLDIPAVSSITHFVFEALEEMRPRWRDLFAMLPRVLPLLPRFLRARRRLIDTYGRAGLPPGPIFPLVGDANLVFTSAALQPRSNFIDARFRFVGPAINPATRGGSAFDADLPSNRPVIYISMGTVHHTDTAFYRQCFQAFADHPGQFILSVGPSADLTQLGAIPQNFIVRPSVPQLDVLQHTDVFVTHGGMNSIHEALYYGVPMVVIPHQMEQLLNGRIVEAQGAGLLLGDRPPYGRVSSPQLRQAVDTLLHNRQYQEKAACIAETLRAAGGFRQAAAEIQALVYQRSAQVLT